MAFLDPTIPIATCGASDCTDCPVADAVHCHFRPAELGHFLLICMPSFLVGGAAVLSMGLTPLLIWIAVFIGFFGFLEIRVMCSHCPHYAEEGATLKCWANHGSPKLWKYRPGPMSTAENVVFFGKHKASAVNICFTPPLGTAGLCVQGEQCSGGMFRQVGDFTSPLCQTNVPPA